MSAEGNKAVVRRWNTEAVSGKRIETCDEVLDKAYVNYSGTESPWAPIARGLDDVKTMLGRISPTFEITIDDIIAEGDKVAIRMTFHEEGKPTANGMALYRLRAGKIVEDWGCVAPLKKE